MRSRSRTFGLLLAGFAAGSWAFAADPTQSPFVPKAGTVAAPVAADTLEFAGVSMLKKQTMVSLYDTREKRSRWIAVGTKADGIEVVSYDVNHDQVVVKQNGQLKILTLRKPSKLPANPLSLASITPAIATGASAAGANTPQPFVTPPAPSSAPSTEPKKNLTQAQQEEEARMFVADMLDIGMQSRKAYEEAQKKAEAEKAAGKSSSSTPSPAL
jgi:hypothetical protein